MHGGHIVLLKRTNRKEKKTLVNSNVQKALPRHEVSSNALYIFFIYNSLNKENLEITLVGYTLINPFCTAVAAFGIDQ